MNITLFRKNTTGLNFLIENVNFGSIVDTFPYIIAENSLLPKISC